MKYCTHCGGALADEAVICPNCGSAVPQAPMPEKNDKRSVGLNIVGFLFPLIGLILFLCLKKDTPVRAKSIGKWTLIGVVIAVVLGVAGGILFAKQATTPVSRTFEAAVGDGVSETITYDAMGDMIHTITDVTYVDTQGATEDEIEAFRTQCDADFADMIALDFGDYQFAVEGEQVVITLKFTGLNDAKHLSQLAATGYGELDKNINYLSLSMTAENLLSTGWVEK